MKAVFKREFLSFFRNVTGWIFIAAFLFLFNLYYFIYNLLYGYPYISYPLSSITFIFMIIIPLLSMRIISEDRKLKTDEMLYTAPVPVWKIVMGKYLAMVAVFSIVMGFVCLCPIYLAQFGTVPFAESYTAILGTWLFGILCIAIGLFVSSLTENVVIAAIGTFAFLFLGYMMDSFCSLISEDGNWLTTILGCLSTTAWMNEMLGGILSIQGIIYYITGSALFIFLTCQVIQHSRWKAAEKKIRRGVFSIGLIIVGIAATVAINFGVSKIPSKYTSIDITYNDVYSITDETEEFLDELEDDVTIYCLINEDDADSTLAETLDHYEEGSKHITVEYIDPETSTEFYTTYTDEEPTDNSLIIVCGDVSTIVDYDDIYEYTIDYTTYTSSVTGYDGEGQITSAINYVISDDMPTVYVLTGHGEIDLGSTFTDALEKANLSTEEVNLLNVDEIGEDVAGVIINGPDTDFSEDDAQKLSDYLAAGGNVILTVNYAAEDTPNLDAVLAEYDIVIEDGLVFEGSSSNYTQYPYMLLPEITSTTYTSGLDNYVLMADSVAITDTEENEDLEWQELLSTSDSAYIKTDLANLTTYEQEDGDEEGTFVIAASVYDDSTEAMLTVFGSCYVFDDSVDSMVSGTNLEMFTNFIADYQDEDSTSISIPVKSYSLTTLTVNQASALTLGLILTIALPIALIIIGIVVWARRRRKQA